MPLPNQLFAVSKNEWDTMEDAGKTHCMHCSMPKAPFGLQQCQTVKKYQTRSLRKVLQ